VSAGGACRTDSPWPHEPAGRKPDRRSAKRALWRRVDRIVRARNLATLAWAQIHTGDVSGALASTHRAITAGVQDAGIWYHSAVIYAAAGRNARAVELVGCALDLNPEFDLYETAHARALLAD
jgi:Flp pilus assembly protein TadD